MAEIKHYLVTTKNAYYTRGKYNGWTCYDLYSYDTHICTLTTHWNDFTIVKHWNGYSRTTQTHLAYFLWSTIECRTTLTKKQMLADCDYWLNDGEWLAQDKITHKLLEV